VLLLIEIVEIGKQLLMTRGALTTFLIANDVAKYFAILPAAFATTYPQLNALNVMGWPQAEGAATYFNLPPNRVVELGTQVML
jgi:potassium-transporting ATPase ATP-binding subunit